MALGRTYRFVVYNATGQTLGSNSVIIKARRWYFSTTGVMTWEGSEASIDSLSTITTASYATGSTIDNSSTAYLGGDIQVHCDRSYVGFRAGNDLSPALDRCRLDMA